MAKKQRDTFAKRAKELARQEKQAAKRARRQGRTPEDGPGGPRQTSDPRPATVVETQDRLRP
jgi:hypothetical protein